MSASAVNAYHSYLTNEIGKTAEEHCGFTFDAVMGPLSQRPASIKLKYLLLVEI